MSITTHPAIEAYFNSETQADTEVFEQVFAPDATVTDEKQTHAGLDAIKAWRQAAKRKYQYTVEPLDSQINDTSVVVRARLEGTFPGGTAVVTYTFGMQHGKIQTLEIR